MKYMESIFNESEERIFARGCTIESEINVNRLKVRIVRMIDHPRKLYKIHYAGRNRVVKIFVKLEGEKGVWGDWIEC